MAEGILDKVGTLLRANVHALLDSALNLNRVAVFDDAVRELRNAREELVAAEGDARGRRTSLEREVQQITQEQAKRDQDLDLLVAKVDSAPDAGSKKQFESASRATQVVYNERNNVLSMKMQLLETVRSEVPRLQNSRMALEARIQVLEAQRSKLEAMIAARKAAEAQGKAMARLDINTEFSADKLMRDEQEALDREQGRLEARQQSMDATADNLLRTEEVDAQLAARRNRLQSK